MSDADLAAARALFAAGAYDRLGRLLPQLLDGAEHGVGAGPAGAARAAGAWVLVSQLAVKQSRTEPAGAYAGLAGAAARRCGNPVVLAAAARAGATPLRRTGRVPEALALLQDARDRLTAASRPSVAELDLAGMVELTAAYTAAQAHHAALARDFADAADETAQRLARRPYDGGRRPLLSASQCTLYRIGIHRHLGDVDTALAHAARLDPRALSTA
ncbi:transcriptional regulator [Streptomyces ossamyceticus]|uniref:transcriptional regulator n=1 Tax=Streptomyces ossamyceticus TaxID=249581 RepID=UPI0034209FCD